MASTPTPTCSSSSRIPGSEKERRHPCRRLTTSHSRKTGRPHCLSPPLLVLTPQREKVRRAQSPFEEENQDVQPPGFEFTHRSKEGAKDDAPPNERGDFPVADRGCKGGGQESPPSKSPFLVTSIPDDRRGTPCGCPYGVASFPGRAVAPPPGPVGTESLDSGNAVGAADRTIPAQFLAGSCRRPGGGGLLRKTWGTLGGGTFLSPSSPPLPSLGSGGAGVGRIGGGTFSPPEGVGVGKPPLLLFLAGFHRTGAGGGAPTSNVPEPKCIQPGPPGQPKAEPNRFPRHI